MRTRRHGATVCDLALLIHNQSIVPMVAQCFKAIACDEEAEPGAVFDEVETIDEIAPRMLALLRSLPSGTRVYLRLKRTVH
jgi:hypothetical protein